MNPDFIDYGHLLNFLKDDSLRQVALYKLKKLTNDEIAAQLGCTSRSVERKLCVIRNKWETMGK
jgi:hypothetical protein